jgi:hypothetical protein
MCSRMFRWPRCFTVRELGVPNATPAVVHVGTSRNLERHTPALLSLAPGRSIAEKTNVCQPASDFDCAKAAGANSRVVPRGCGGPAQAWATHQLAAAPTLRATDWLGGTVDLLWRIEARGVGGGRTYENDGVPCQRTRPSSSSRQSVPARVPPSTSRSTPDT